MNKFTIDTHSYNSRRHSKPWIARVDFSNNPKGDFIWGSWAGEEHKGTGSDGVLTISADEEDIVAEGQKDFRGNGGHTTWYQVRQGALVELSGKAEAYKLATSK